MVAPHVAKLTLNRPHRLNAFIPDLSRALIAALIRAEEDADVRAIVLTGAGRAFCTGEDLQDGMVGDNGEINSSLAFSLLQDITRTIRRLPKPVIGAVQGYAVGAGAELALACDLIVMSEETKLTFPETRLGLSHSNGITHILPRMIGLHKARELLFFGDWFEAKDLLALGLVNWVVPADRYLDHAIAQAERLASLAPIALASTKAALDQGSQMSLEASLHLEHQIGIVCANTEDAKEGGRAYREKRPPRFIGK